MQNDKDFNMFFNTVLVEALQRDNVEEMLTKDKEEFGAFVLDAVDVATKKFCAMSEMVLNKEEVKAKFIEIMYNNCL